MIQGDMITESNAWSLIGSWMDTKEKPEDITGACGVWLCFSWCLCRALSVVLGRKVLGNRLLNLRNCGHAGMSLFSVVWRFSGGEGAWCMQLTFKWLRENSVPERDNANMAKYCQLVILGKGHGVVFIILFFQVRAGGTSTTVPGAERGARIPHIRRFPLPTVLIQGVQGPSLSPDHTAKAPPETLRRGKGNSPSGSRRPGGSRAGLLAGCWPSSPAWLSPACPHTPECLAQCPRQAETSSLTLQATPAGSRGPCRPRKTPVPGVHQSHPWSLFSVTNGAHRCEHVARAQGSGPPD